jgi:pimeloyl-ACP methyl ester carboxylesterase
MRCSLVLVIVGAVLAPSTSLALQTVFTNTNASSLRYYLESSLTPLRLTVEQRVQVPTHVAHFPHEMPFPPRTWVERRYRVARWTPMPRGGHFAALEAPELLAADIVASSERAGTAA